MKEIGVIVASTEKLARETTVTRSPRGEAVTTVTPGLVIAMPKSVLVGANPRP